jgi:predicted subunit of tRNA(5-methylaminomethyl-2-thiouridylate) methyltransferase
MADGGSVALMFSGGVDSTTAAMMLARKHDRVHLLSYSNGYGHYRIGRTRERVSELRRICGDRFEHEVLSVQDLFESFVAGRAEEEFRRYGSGFVWCMGCKMAMHTSSIEYCLGKGISRMADGSSQATGEMVEQMLVSVHLIRRLYARWGVDFRTPVYTIPREEEIDYLKTQGFRMGFRIGSGFLGVQPKCRPGELYYLPFLVFNQPPVHDEDKVTAFIEEKGRAADAHLAEWCRRMGIPTPVRSGEA